MTSGQLDMTARSLGLTVSPDVLSRDVQVIG